MKSEFASYEQALKLNQLGFNEPCFGWYDCGFLRIGNVEPKHIQGINEYLAPLKQQVFRWFRERYNFYSTINVDITIEPKFCYSIYEYDLEKYSEGWWMAVVNSDLYYTPEEAEDACINKLIELAKKKPK